MNEPIYFSKIQFVEGFIYNEPRSVIFIDLLKREFLIKYSRGKEICPPFKVRKRMKNGND